MQDLANYCKIPPRHFEQGKYVVSKNDEFWKWTIHRHRFEKIQRLPDYDSYRDRAVHNFKKMKPFWHFSIVFLVTLSQLLSRPRTTENRTTKRTLISSVVQSVAPGLSVLLEKHISKLLLSVFAFATLKNVCACFVVSKVSWFLIENSTHKEKPKWID